MEKIVYRKILVPHDGSDLSTPALLHALSLAIVCNAEIVLLRVISPLISAESMFSDSIGGYHAISSASDAAITLQEEARKRAVHELGKLKNDFEAQGVRFVKPLVEEGISNRVIIEIAKKENCNLIIMSTHGRTGLGRALLGSVTDYVIRHASCPVLVVHPNEKAQKKGGE